MDLNKIYIETIIFSQSFLILKYISENNYIVHIEFN